MLYCHSAIWWHVKKIETNFRTICAQFSLKLNPSLAIIKHRVLLMYWIVIDTSQPLRGAREKKRIILNLLGQIDESPL